jgi:hypothetical protein
VCAAVGLLALPAGFARTQVPQPMTPVPPVYRPPVSPYLNLLRQGQSPGLNYYNLVRPQLQYNASIYQLQGQVGANRQGLAALEQAANQPAAGLPPTGFIPQFQNYRVYFMTYSGTGGFGTAPLTANRGVGTGTGAVAPTRPAGATPAGTPPAAAPTAPRR